MPIDYSGGTRRLRAGDVSVTNVSVGYEAGETDTVAWAELDDDSGPSDTVNGEDIRIPIRFPSIVTILWRRDGDERAVEA